MAGTALPAGLVVLGLAGLRRAWSHAALAAWTATWCAGAVTALVLYDTSRLRIALGCAVPCAVLLAMCLAASLVARSRWDLRAGALALAGAAIGAWFPFAVRAPVASTRPLGGPAPRVEGTRIPHGAVEVGPAVVDTRTAAVTLRDAGIEVRVQPLLRFWSRAPDRGWTLLARRRERSADTRLRTSFAVTVEHGVRLFAQGVAEHVLDVQPRGTGGVELASWAVLEAPEYAHQCAFASFVVGGIDAPRIELSPAVGQPIGVLPYDYPAGRPARFATLLAPGVLHVLEATSGEKGPFTTLAEGPLPAEGALEMTLYDGARARVRIVLRDFASQASTELSPTAGWGVPQNDVSFALDERSGHVEINATWAATGIGRGFDTVGHAAGTYRSRVAVEILP